jgi:hypothetical protein
MGILPKMNSPAPELCHLEIEFHERKRERERQRQRERYSPEATVFYVKA